MKLEEWGTDFLNDILARAGAREDGEFQENVFTEEAIGYLVAAGECLDPEVKYHRGRGIKVNAWDLHEENDSVDLFVTIFDASDPCRKVPRSEAIEALARCRKFLEKSLEELWKEIEPASPGFEVAQALNSIAPRLKRVKVYLLTNGRVDPEPFPDEKVGDVEVSHYICDLDKLFQASGKGAVREPIEIGADLLAGGLACVRLPDDNKVYDSYVGMMPGDVLADMYDRWGQRILEQNVRSYLQARGAVNKGILETVRDHPEMFLAYNNGISTIAEDALVEPPDGVAVVVRRLRNFQVVNGAQTTATLHDARKNRGLDITTVYVPFKLTVLRNKDKVDELVPSISRYANTQNKVSLSDFSANDPYHIALERVSRVTWVPSEKGKSTTKWFYERARGGYINEMNREGTEAKKRAFRAMYPKSQMLNKTSLAKYWMTWARLPYLVSLGAEKNFSRFMEQHAKGSVPDETYFRRLVAKAILFQECDTIVARQGYGGYKANVVTYTVAWLSFLTAQRIDLDSIWEKQAPSEAVKDALLELSGVVWDHLNHPPPNVRNLSEWAKREACWTTLRDKPHALPRLDRELLAVGLEESYPSERPRDALPLSAEAEAELAAVESKKPEWWFGMARWAAKTGSLRSWERSLAFSLGEVLRSGRRPSPKQAHQGARILREALDAGYRHSGEDGSSQGESSPGREQPGTTDGERGERAPSSVPAGTNRGEDALRGRSR